MIQDPPHRVVARLRARAPLLIGVALLAQMVFAMLTAAAGDSPVFDEPLYLKAGLSYFAAHNLNVNPEHPPLSKLVGAAPVWLERRGVDRTVPDLYAYVRDHPNHAYWLARLPMILVTALVALVVFGFARDLFGTAGGLVALGAASLSPILVSNGHLVTNDVPVAGAMLASLWFLWRTRHRAILWIVPAGLAYGLALASKFSALLLGPVVVALAIWAGFRPGTAARSPLGRLANGSILAGIALLVALGTLWSAYLGVDPKLRFGAEPPLAAQATGPLVRAAAILPVPKPFKEGLKIQIWKERNYQRSFLFGSFRKSPRFYYYPVALLVKTPLGTLGLWLVALVALFRGKRRLQHIAYVAGPAAALLGVSMLSGRDLGVRYVLLVPLLLAVACGALGAVFKPLSWRSAVATLLLAATAASVWHAHPYQLSYVNEAFGGPAGAHKILFDADVDWGQDLRRLAGYLSTHRFDEPVWLLYFGMMQPKSYGIEALDAKSSPPDQIHGIFIASVSSLNGYDREYAAVVRGREPIAQVGHSILVYRVP